MIQTLPDLIRSKIQVDPKTGCWIWIGAIDRAGYGRIRRDRRTQFTHRYIYALLRPAERLDGLVMDHLCRRSACCNPEHLEPVTQLVNHRRGLATQAARSQYANHLWCPKGHPLFGTNLYRYRAKDKDGREYWNKQCRTCRHDNIRRYRAARKAARQTF